ncbi:MAG: hypothetical protein AAB472_01680 [Patescibacteria group bacterium]
MRHEKIARIAARPERAEYRYVKKAWGKIRKRFLYLYAIYPPRATPLLPSDESLKTLLETIPSMRFHTCERFVDRDVLFIYGKNFNLFTTRASRDARRVRTTFLEQVAEMAEDVRIVPDNILEATRAFLSKYDFKSIEWNGRQAIAYSAGGGRYEGCRVVRGELVKPFRAFEQLCKPILPFYLEVAPS